jgi:transcriptional regulator with XRE-family HTH domain
MEAAQLNARTDVRAQLTAALARAADHGVTVYAACKRSGISQTTVLRWKKGEHQPTEAALGAFCEAVESIIQERAKCTI